MSPFVVASDSRADGAAARSAPGGATKAKGRRAFLKAGLVGGALVAAGSLVALVRTSGYELPPERARSLKSLEPWQFVFVQHAARRIAAPDRPGDARIPTPDDTDTAGFVDAYVAGMH